MNKQQNKAAILYATILYFCGFFLFLEWLYPLKDISDTNNIFIFIIYTMFCFIISALQLKWWIGFLLKGFGLLFILNGLYFNVPIVSAMWIEQVQVEFVFNIQALFSQQWYYLTPLFRSFLFLLLIWLMSYLLHYWFVQMKRIFLFVLLTFIYITILDTFTVYDGAMSIVRTFIVSFIALGIANLMKELSQESIHFAWVKKSPVWLMPLVVVVFISSLIGFAAPKAEPIWPDPVPFIQSAAENVGSNGSGPVQKVGYGEDDSRLGGSFIQDDTPVFYASTPERHYWRIETKDEYTGKGWVSSSDSKYELQPNGSIDLETFSSNVETERRDALVEFQENESINKLVYPYGISQVEGLEGEEAVFLDQQSDAIEARRSGEVTNLTTYQLTYDHPSFELNELRESSEPYRDELLEHYTQLPDTLPERVVDLAEEITNPHETRYEKVKAVERYFASNDFEYRTTDVPVPRGDQDYVDQFLFDSRIGYCDNFSTSMVVLLRAIDIPARWVKGFTSGQLIGGENATELYEVTNGNAHSWVEVYFPETGWVPFEPTQGFSNLSDFHVDIDNASNTDLPQTEDDALEAPERNDLPEQPESDVPTDEAAEQESDQTDGTNFTFKWWYAAILVALIVIIGIGIYKTRFRWQTKALAVKMKNGQDAKSFQEAYHHLIKLLRHYGYTKDPDQTLREFANRIDIHYSTDEMGQLTSYYERLLYKNELNESQLNELTQLWKNLIKRIMG
ncbi:DUF3488 and transglutaminase-like domain-containing protein [Oceanobacillus profundus]|uniref:transglutaminase TgpA family protein n=1 Tax=Oceanobacillus profundus TaxID=372463 RepID=UPI00204149C2|nr:transglutaminaseTgpA domain-containing protein [Oceanobacillus profundus]MCM3397798.1 DUF3488 and transglutaminase-like domain-containing protein [Oceanobacillus profundus]